MMRVSATLLLLMSCTLALGMQNSSEWIKYTSAEGRYSVSVPSEPKLSTQETNASTGEKFPQYLASSVQGNGVFMIGYFDYPPNMTFAFDKARDGMLGGMHATLLGEDSISLGSASGRQLKILAKSSDEQVFIVRARFYDVGRRIYVLQCIFPQSEDGPAIMDKAGKFLDSFKVEARP